MTPSDAPEESGKVSNNDTKPLSAAKENQIRQESSAQYKRSIEKINRAHDRDIEQALSRISAPL